MQWDHSYIDITKKEEWNIIEYMKGSIAIKKVDNETVGKESMY